MGPFDEVPVTVMVAAEATIVPDADVSPPPLKEKLQPLWETFTVEPTYWTSQCLSSSHDPEKSGHVVLDPESPPEVTSGVALFSTHSPLEQVCPSAAQSLSAFQTYLPSCSLHSRVSVLDDVQTSSSLWA